MDQKLSLKTILDDENALKAQLIEQFGEIDETTEMLIDAVRALREGKVDRVATMLKVILPSHIEACKRQIEHLKRIDDRLEAYTKFCLESLPSGDKELSGLCYKLKLAQGPLKVVVHDESKIPAYYFNETVTYQPDKRKLKTDLELGLKIEGVSLERDEFLRVSEGKAVPKAKSLKPPQD